jgi:ribosomal protein L18E
MVAPKIFKKIMTWNPNVGKQTKHFLQGITHIDEEQKTIIVDESLRVLKSAGQPNTDRQKVGLVVGYVQSGKTMSLTCVSSLARDNGYGHIIILCGVTNELFKQNRDRVVDDLIKSSKNAFVSKSNPKKNQIAFYKGKFDLWKSSNGKNPTVITFLLKNTIHINNLADVLEKVGADIKGISTLIIDDEAHMAGLNASFSKNEESRIYKDLKNLRKKISDYAYLQYTATPQAPLLVRLNDCVSPEFANVLTPGKGYYGGKEFFPEKPNKDLVTDIPESELPESNDADVPFCPPKSFISALQQFLIGVADNLTKDDRSSFRSMLIHPHKEQKWHYAYEQFTRKQLEFYERILSSDDEDDKRNLLKDFNYAYEEIKRTYKKISDFKSITKNILEAIKQAKAEIIVVNANKKDEIEWSPATILIGGEVLGVGFTVKGLTISYMLRTSAKGQIDSMQQRGRFFGYRGEDIYLTRVYLSKETHEAFRDYVKHEEGTREELKKMQESGKSLKKWRRNFLVRAGMQLTRKNIQSLSTIRDDAAGKTHPVQPYIESEDHNPHHLKILDDVTNKWKLEPDPATKPNWSNAQKHLSGYFDAETVLDKIIAEFSWGNSEDGAYWDTHYYLLKLLVNEAKKAGKKIDFKVMVMRPSERGKSNRGVNAAGWELLQGRDPSNKDKSDKYPGDKNLADPNVTTLQLHCYTFTKNGNVLGKDIVVPIIIPSKSDKRNMEMVIQDSPIEE